MTHPQLGDIVRYRGKEGLQTTRAAIVTADIRTLDPRGVERGDVPPLTSLNHVHLWVYTPSVAGGFPEYDVPRGYPGVSDGPEIPPGSWEPQPTASPLV
jgi:hypothetical protein